MEPWSPEIIERAAANVALYKRLRRVIMGADVYHLTSPPSHNDPAGRMAIQYVSPDRQRSLVLAYRLAKGRTEQTFTLRGLEDGRHYRATRDGQPARTLPGRELTVALDSEWRAAAIELEAQPRE